MYYGRMERKKEDEGVVGGGGGKLRERGRDEGEGERGR